MMQKKPCIYMIVISDILNLCSTAICCWQAQRTFQFKRKNFKLKLNFFQITLHRMYGLNYDGINMGAGSEIYAPNSENKGGLYLSNFTFAQNYSQLKEKKIGAVVSAVKLIDLNYPEDMQIAHLKISVEDDESEDLFSHFENSNSFIEQNLKRTNVLVHCAAGISRSTTLVIAYLIQNKEFDFTKALEFVKTQRSIACPNYGFQKQLKDYSDKIHQK